MSRLFQKCGKYKLPVPSLSLFFLVHLATELASQTRSPFVGLQYTPCFAKNDPSVLSDSIIKNKIANQAFSMWYPAYIAILLGQFYDGNNEQILQ